MREYLGLMIIIVVIALLEVMLSMLTFALISQKLGIASIMPLLLGNGLIYYGFSDFCNFIAQVLSLEKSEDDEIEE